MMHISTLNLYCIACGERAAETVFVGNGLAACEVCIRKWLEAVVDAKMAEEETE